MPEIDQQFVPFVLFAAVALIIVAVLMVVRDLIFGSQPEQPEPSIERLSIDDAQPQTALERFDRWFDNLIGEGGYGFSPLAGFLAAASVGVMVGGLLFLWKENLLLTAVGMAAGMVLTIVVFVVQRNRRRALLQEQYPEVIELIARAVRAGETLDQAIELVGNAAAQPLAREFSRCARQLQMGLSMDATMRALNRRVPITETRILAAALTVQRRTGGNLPLTLERLARVIRERLHYRQSFRAATASGRSSTYVMVGVTAFVLIYLIVYRPEYLQKFFESVPGQIMFVVAIVLQVTGLVWIARLLRPQY